MLDRQLFPNLALVRLMVSGKMGFTDGRPRDDSSSAVKEHKAELKTKALHFATSSYFNLDRLCSKVYAVPFLLVSSGCQV